MPKTKEKTPASDRPLYLVAAEIAADWEKPYFGAVPYLNAMFTMVKPGENYMADSEWNIIIYFLSNATTWRGEVARRIKAELKTMKGRVKDHERPMTKRIKDMEPGTRFIYKGPLWDNKSVWILTDFESEGDFDILLGVNVENGSTAWFDHREEYETMK